MRNLLNGAVRGLSLPGIAARGIAMLCVTVTCATVACVTTLTAIGCTTRIAGEPISEQQLDKVHRALITGYFETINATAAQGSPAQEQLFAHTQHPDFRDAQCSLQGLTVTVDPAYSTLHADPDWRFPLTEESPRGTIYVVAATITVRRNTVVLASQIGSLHVIVLDDTAYGFSPCPA